MEIKWGKGYRKEETGSLEQERRRDGRRRGRENGYCVAVT